MTARTTPDMTAARTSTLSRVATAVGQAWTSARRMDRRLMEIRTDLSRHSG